MHSCTICSDPAPSSFAHLSVVLTCAHFVFLICDHSSRHTCGIVLVFGNPGRDTSSLHDRRPYPSPSCLVVLHHFGAKLYLFQPLLVDFHFPRSYFHFLHFCGSVSGVTFFSLHYCVFQRLPHWDCCAHLPRLCFGGGEALRKWFLSTSSPRTHSTALSGLSHFARVFWFLAYFAVC